MNKLPRLDPRGLTSLIIPAYNPGATIERTWHRLAEFVRKAPDPWEVIYVCDGCTDGTPDRLRNLGATADGRLRLIQYSANRGKGFAVRTGLAAARGRWLIFTDADLAYPLGDVEHVAARLRTGEAVVVGSREHPESEILLPTGLVGYAFRRRLQSLPYGWLARTVLGFRYSDPQAGLKGLQAAVARGLLARFRQDGFAFDCELLTACARFDIPVTEVPVHVRLSDRHTTTGIGSALQTVRQLFAIRDEWRAAPGARTHLPVSIPVRVA